MPLRFYIPGKEDEKHKSITSSSTQRGRLVFSRGENSSTKITGQDQNRIIKQHSYYPPEVTKSLIAPNTPDPLKKIGEAISDFNTFSNDLQMKVSGPGTPAYQIGEGFVMGMQTIPSAAYGFIKGLLESGKKKKLAESLLNPFRESLKSTYATSPWGYDKGDKPTSTMSQAVGLDEKKYPFIAGAINGAADALTPGAFIKFLKEGKSIEYISNQALKSMENVQKKSASASAKDVTTPQTEAVRDPQNNVFSANVDMYRKNLPKTEKGLQNKIKSLDQQIKKATDTTTIRKLHLQLFATEDELRNISKFKTNSLKNAPLLEGEQIQNIVDSIDMEYGVKGNEQTVRRAKQMVDVDMEGVMTTIKGQRALNSAEDAAAAWWITKNLRQEAEASGEFTRLKDWLKSVQPKVTSTAQSLQAISVWKKLTPEGILNVATKSFDEVADQVKDLLPGRIRKVEKDVKKAIDAIDQVSKEAADTAIKELKPEEILAKRVGSTLKKSAPKIDPLKDMVNELFRIAKESPLPERELYKRSPVEYLTKAIQEKHKYADVWEKAKAVVTKKYKDDPAAAQMLDNYFKKGIVPTYSDSTLNSSMKTALNELNLKLAQLARKSPGDKQKALDELTGYLVKATGAAQDDAAILASKIKTRFDELMKQKSGSILKQLLKEGKLKVRKSAYNKLAELINLSAFDDGNLRELIKKKYGLPVLDNAMAKSLVDQAKKIEVMADGREKDVAIQLMLKTISDQIPRTLLEKVSSIQTMAQLLNPKTAIRNLGGNFLFGGLENASDVLGTAIDIAVSKITRQRTKALPDLRTQGKGFVTGLKFGVEDALKGIDTSGIKTQFDLPETRVFRNTLMNKIETALNIELRATDRAFYKAAFDDSLRMQMKFKGVKEATTEMIEQAHFDGLYRTFQDDNVATKLFTGLKSALNVGKKFGLGDLVLKYPKTPANLLMRGIDYSPAGILKSIAELAKPLMGKAFNQKKFVESVSRTTIGTGLFLGAIALYNYGIITGKRSSDKDISNLEKEVGLGGYRFNLSALKRFVLTGFNSDEAKAKEGDTLINYDWLQPASISAAAGANASQQVKDKGKTSPLDMLAAVVAGIEGGASTLAEQPVVTGLAKLSQGFGSGEDIVQSLMNVAASAPASFIPTLINQVRQWTDNYTRDTKTDIFAQSMVNQVINKIPGLSKLLPERVNTLGEKTETYQGGTNNFINVFFNPAFLSRYKVTPGTKLIMDLYSKTEETKQFPRDVSSTKTIMINGEKVELTGKQKAKFQEIIGQTTMKYLNALARNKTLIYDRKTGDFIEKDLPKGREFTNLPTEQQVEGIYELLNSIGDYGRTKLKEMYFTKK